MDLLEQKLKFKHDEIILQVGPWMLDDLIWVDSLCYRQHLHGK